MTSHYTAIHTYILLLMERTFEGLWNNQVMEAAFGDL